MSALAKMLTLPADAVEAAIAPLVNSIEAKKRADDESSAAEARAALKKHVEDTKAIRQADAALAKAKADEARAESDLARLRAARVEAENQTWAARDPWSRERDRLCRAAYAPHVKDEARRLVYSAVQALQDSGLLGIDRPLRSLLRLRTQVTAICDGGELPPTDDLLEWLNNKLSQIEADVENAVAEHRKAREDAARADALKRIITI